MLRKLPDILLDKFFLSILAVFFSAYWFYWYKVTQNGGILYFPPNSIGHHPVPWDILVKDFWKNLLLYYHTQVPFYTMYSYLLMFLEPETQGFRPFYVFHLILGGFALYSLYRLGLLLGASRGILALVFILFVGDPGFYVFFTQAWNDFVTMCLVSILAYRCHRLLAAPNFTNSFWFFAVLAVLASVRTIFHPAMYVLPVFAIMLLYLKQHRPTVVKSFIIPLLFLIWPYVRTWLMIGTLSIGSTQASLAMKANAFEFHMPFDVRVEGVEKGYFSEFIFCYWMPPGPYEYKGHVYDSKYCTQLGNEYMSAHLTDLFSPEILAKYKDVPILSDPRFFEDVGVPFPMNQNSFHSQVMADVLKRDSLAAIWHHPEYYFKGVLHSIWQYFRPGSDYQFLIAVNSRKLPEWMGDAWIKRLPFDPRYAEIKLGGPNSQKAHYISSSFSPYLAIGITAIMIYGGALAYGLRKPLIPAFMHIGYAMAMTIGYYYFSALQDWGEQKELMLFIIMPGVFLLLSLLTHGLVRWKRPSADQMSLVFMLCTILYFSAFIIGLPGSEQERYRLGVNGLYIVLLSVFLTHGRLYMLGLHKQWKKKR